eukprot:m.333207 g.333207  ORF g.333207 m.333207 type:complete len:297 (-) comp17097_c0_seq1:94-984(-)
MAARVCLVLLVLVFVGARSASLNTTKKSTCPSTVGPGDHEVTVRVGSSNRKYEVHVPDMDPGTQAPVFINVHGCTSSVTKFKSITEMNSYADQHKFISVYPEGTGVIKGWNAYSSQSCPFKTENDQEFFIALLANIKETLCVAENKIFLNGFSNGAEMVTALTCNRLVDDQVAGYAWGGSDNYQNFGCSSKPMLFTCGVSDGYCERGLELFDSITQDCKGSRTETQVTATTTKFSKSQCGSQNVVIDFYQVDGLDHCYPGAPCCDDCSNQNPENINFSEVLLEYFGISNSGKIQVQ